MSAIGYRKKGEHGPLYNPERDYAYITPTLMRVAIENMDAADHVDVVRWKEENNITQQEIIQIAEALADAQQDFVNAADPVTSFEQALNRHGFYKFRPCVRNLLLASIGEVFCAAWFKAVREVSVVGEEPAAAEDMARFSATVREFATRHGMPVHEPNYMAEHLKIWNNVLQARINELGKQVRELTEELQLCRRMSQPVAKPKTFIGKLFGLLQKGNKCPSTGCTKTRCSSGRS